MKYYSEILEKNFDTEEDLVKAEKEHAEAEAKKAEAKALVKKESDEVNKAFVARNEARKIYNEKAADSYKKYLQDMKLARETYEESIKEVKEAKRKAELEFDNVYREFDKKHPEGYRLVLKDGDDVLTVEQEKNYDYNDFFEDIDKVVNSFFKLW